MDETFKSRVFFIFKIAAAIFIMAAAVYAAPDVFLLIFAGLLVSIFLTSLSGTLVRWVGLSSGWALAVVIVALFLFFAAASYFAAPNVADQFDDLVKKVPESVENIKAQLASYTWGKNLLEEAQPENMLQGSRRVIQGVGGAFSSVLGWFANFVIIVFIGLYGAIEPGLYRRGFLHLLPKRRRARAAEVLSEVGETLKWWLIGKFFGMAVIGAMTTIGLWLLNVPLALILGLIAALFTFIPNIGPILAAVPAILLGLAESPEQALYVGLLYLGTQAVESYLLTPMVQRKTIELPPALTLSAQVFMGIILGGLGVALATPLTAVALVATKMLYVEDELGDTRV
jgi:predicted PurR-regulated permease PerM